MPTDNELMDAYLGCDEASFTKLFNRYKNKLLSYVRYTFKLAERADTAEDCVQEVLIKVYKLKAKGFRRQGDILNYILRMTYNEALGILRRRRRDIVEPDTDRVAAAADENEQSMTEEQVEALLTQLAQLDDEAHRVVFLRFWFKLSYPAIAEITGRNENTLKSIVSRALRTLSTRLGGENHE